MCTIRSRHTCTWGLAGDLAGICRACLPAHTPRFHSHKKRVQREVNIFVCHGVYQRVSSSCRLWFGIWPRYANIPINLKAFLRPPKQMQPLCSDNFCISCSSTWESSSLSQPSDPVCPITSPAQVSLLSSKLQACSHHTAILPNTFSEALASYDCLSSCIKIQLDNKLSRATTMLIFDLLIQYYVLPTVSN